VGAAGRLLRAAPAPPAPTLDPGRPDPRSLLWLLSTRLGTLLLGGRHAFVPRWPFLLPFTQLPLANRQRILSSWAASRLGTLRKVGGRGQGGPGQLGAGQPSSLEPSLRRP
jgi:hypothetical protein